MAVGLASVPRLFGATARVCLIAIAAGWLAIVASLTFFQRDLLYFRPSEVVTPEAAGLRGITASHLTAPDGARIATWSAPAPEDAPTVLFFHGNGGSHGILAGKYQRLRDVGYGLFAMTYRGYPGSSGQPNEAANFADALMAYDALVASGVPPSRIVLYGESLGSGIAIQVAAQRPVAAVVLESPYASIADVAAAEYWYVPVRWLLLDRYDSLAHAPRVTAPVLILHGRRDDLIPVAHARRLFDALPGRKSFIEYPDGGHVGLMRLGGLAEIQSFIRTVMGGR
ncbi:MAG: lysophospholipase [Hyphomicrobiaceae bacterium]|nr:lysophospholipase [Hyphomicrobiaceae bacterium]